MISVRSFDTIAEAAGALGQNSIYFGGGTLVMRALNYGEQRFDSIVRTTDPSLRAISISGDRISIGASVTMSNVIASRELAFLEPVARSVGGPAVRNMGTVGGNLFAQHPYGDFTTALLALDGIIHKSDGSQQDLEQFLANRSSHVGLIQSVSIARPSGQDFRYKKVSRIKPKGISVMSIAAWLPQSAGRVSQPRIAFGAMGETPIRAKAAETALENANLDPSGIQPALDALSRDLQPFDDPIASGWYRTQVAPVHLKRLLLNQGDR